MFKKLKQYSINKIIDKNVKTRDLSQINAPLNTLGFLVDDTLFQDFEALYDYSDFLGIQRKSIHVFSFSWFKKNELSLRQNQISDKGFNWNGTIKCLNAQEFLSEPFDVLIGYYEGSHQFLDMMVSQSKAKFKVGGIGADRRIFDLLISIEIIDIESFKHEVKKYLTVLNKLQ